MKDKKTIVLISAGITCLLLTLLAVTEGKKYWLHADTFVSGALFTFGILFLIEGTIRRGMRKLSTLEEVCALMQSMLNSASEYVMITTGRLWERLYLNQSGIKEVIREKARQGVQFEIISGKNIDLHTLREYIDLLLLPNFYLYLAEENPFPHALLVDGRKLRIEEHHPPGATERKNIYIERPSASLLYFGRCFANHKQKAEKLTYEKAQRLLEAEASER